MEDLLRTEASIGSEADLAAAQKFTLG